MRWFFDQFKMGRSVFHFSVVMMTLVMPVVGLQTAEAKFSCQAVYAPVDTYRYGQATKALNQAQVGAQIQYGFESEYTLDQLNGIVKYYKFQNIPTEQWLAQTPQERAANVKQVLGQRRNAFVEDSGLVLFREDAPSFLPRELAIDSTGNVEIIIPPMNSREEYNRVRKGINQAFEGIGSMQTTMSVPQTHFFQYLKSIRNINGEVTLATELSAYVGFSNFHADFDTLDKLGSGYERLQKNPNTEVARSFNHPFLGPMTKIKHDSFVNTLIANSNGRLMTREELSFIKNKDDSFKYFGGTAYRPDLAMPNRIVWEVRDAHNNLEVLDERVNRLEKFLLEMPQTFETFADVPAFDSVADFEKLGAGTQEMLKTLFPARLKEGYEYDPREVTANEMFRNFAWPLKSWDKYINTFNVRGLGPAVVYARESYLMALNDIQIQYAAGTMTREVAKVKVQAALVTFAADSQLLKAFKNWKSKHQNPEVNLRLAQ